MMYLAMFYTIDIYAYAVMSNHYHIVLNVDSNAARVLSDRQVITRWLAISRPKLEGDAYHRAFKAILDNPPRIAILRERLGCLSSFMGKLDETIARRAYKEDGCKGHFWEKRFQCQKALGEKGLAATMVYTDLNPVRAGIAADPADATHTSLRRRLSTRHKRIGPLNAPSKPSLLSLSLDEYVQLCRWTASTDPLRAPPTNAKQATWLKEVLPKPGNWTRAIGSKEDLEAYAAEIGVKWIRGTRGR